VRGPANQSTGQTFKEGTNINKSLLTLSTVIGRLSAAAGKAGAAANHIPYRDSKVGNGSANGSLNGYANGYSNGSVSRSIGIALLVYIDSPPPHTHTQIHTSPLPARTATVPGSIQAHAAAVGGARWKRAHRSAVRHLPSGAQPGNGSINGSVDPPTLSTPCR
jgi:hypothetical protein